MEQITYTADGLNMRSEFFPGDVKGEGRRPGVLVFPEAYGLSDHVRERAQRLAEMGYPALACDLHGEGALIPDLGTAMGLIGVLREDPIKTRARARGALEALLARPEVDPKRTAAIGFCFGGTMALELARSGAEIVAAVGFHSGLQTSLPGDAKNIKGKVLACIGADDPWVDVEQRKEFEAEMRAGGVDWQLHAYGGVVHSFTNKQAEKAGQPQAARYSATADERSWVSMRELFHEVFA